MKMSVTTSTVSFVVEKANSVRPRQNYGHEHLGV
jgi:hypothetical protein